MKKETLRLVQVQVGAFISYFQEYPHLPLFVAHAILPLFVAHAILTNRIEFHGAQFKFLTFTFFHSWNIVDDTHSSNHH